MSEKIPAPLTAEQGILLGFLESSFKGFKSETDPAKKKDYINDFLRTYNTLAEGLGNDHPVVQNVYDIYSALATLEEKPDDLPAHDLVEVTDSITDLVTGITVNSAEVPTETAPAPGPTVLQSEPPQPEPASEQVETLRSLDVIFNAYKTETDIGEKRKRIDEFFAIYDKLNLADKGPLVEKVADIYRTLEKIKQKPDNQSAQQPVSSPEPVLQSEPPQPEPVPAPKSAPVTPGTTPTTSEKKEETPSAEKDKEVADLKAQIAELKGQNKRMTDAFNKLVEASEKNRTELLDEMKKLSEQAKVPKAEAKPTESVNATQNQKPPEKTSGTAPEAEPKNASAEAAPKTSSEAKSTSPESRKEKVNPGEIFHKKNELEKHDIRLIVESLSDAIKESNAAVIAALGVKLEAIADEPEFESWRDAYGHTTEGINFKNPTVEEAKLFATQYETYRDHREIFFKSESIKSELVTFVNMSLMDAYQSYIPITQEDATVLKGKLDELVNPEGIALDNPEELAAFKEKIAQVERIGASMERIRTTLIPEYDKAHRRLFAEARFFGLEKKLNAQAGFEGVRPGSAERMMEVLDTMLADAESLEAELTERKTKGMKGTRQEAIAGFFAKYDGLMNAFGISGPSFFQAMGFFVPFDNINVKVFKEKIQEIRDLVDGKKHTYREAAEKLKTERQQVIETLGAQDFIAKVARERVTAKLTKARNAMFEGAGLKTDSALAEAELARAFEGLGDDPHDVSGLGEILKNAPVKDTDGREVTAREARINQGNKAIAQMIQGHLDQMTITRNKEFQGFMSLIDSQLKRDKFGEEKEDKKRTIIAALRGIQAKLESSSADTRVDRRKREYVKRAIDTLEARIDPAKVKGARTK